VGPRPLSAKSLWVLRHAKAVPQGRDDHGRPITARGRRQATEVGRHVARAPVTGATRPELVLSSSARRALQTAELVVAELGGEVELVVEHRLYQADPDDVVDILRELGHAPSSVLVVGHNPTVYELALLMVDREDTAGNAALEQGFPTATLAVIGVGAASWARLASGTGTLLDLHTPED
jgi:phosphohistidine phosphatase